MNPNTAREILGLETQNPSAKEVKNAFRKIMLKEHPDKLFNNAAFKALSKEEQEAKHEAATARAKQVNEAYELLTSPPESHNTFFDDGGPFTQQSTFTSRNPWEDHLDPNEINKLRASIISMLHPEQSPQEQSDNILSDANIQRFNDISKARGIGPGVNMAWMRSLYNALFCVFFVDALDQNTMDVIFNLVEQKAHGQLMIEVPIYCALQARLTQLDFALPDRLVEQLDDDSSFANMSFDEVKNRFEHIQDLKLALNILCYTPDKQLSESNIQGIGFDIEPSRALNEAYYPYFLDVCNQVPKAMTTYAYFMCKVAVADISEEQKLDLLEKGRNSIPSDFSILFTSHLFICKAQAILQANPNEEGYQEAISLHEELHASQSLQV